MATSKSSMVTLLGNLFPVYGSLILGLFIFVLTASLFSLKNGHFIYVQRFCYTVII